MDLTNPIANFNVNAKKMNKKKLVPLENKNEKLSGFTSKVYAGKNN